MLALSALGLAYEWMARDRAAFGRRLLSRGRVVVTDRLHGHILSLLMGIPNVVVDTGYGKVAGVRAAWTARSPTSRLAASPGEVPGLARELLALA
jgi:pyruvyl transferase EpsO